MEDYFSSIRRFLYDSSETIGFPDNLEPQATQQHPGYLHLTSRHLVKEMEDVNLRNMLMEVGCLEVYPEHSDWFRAYRVIFAQDDGILDKLRVVMITHDKSLGGEGRLGASKRDLEALKVLFTPGLVALQLCLAEASEDISEGLVSFLGSDKKELGLGKMLRSLEIYNTHIRQRGKNPGAVIEYCSRFSELRHANMDFELMTWPQLQAWGKLRYLRSLRGVHCIDGDTDIHEYDAKTGTFRYGQAFHPPTTELLFPQLRDFEARTICRASLQAVLDSLAVQSVGDAKEAGGSRRPLKFLKARIGLSQMSLEGKVWTGVSEISMELEGFSKVLDAICKLPRLKILKLEFLSATDTTFDGRSLSFPIKTGALINIAKACKELEFLVLYDACSRSGYPWADSHMSDGDLTDEDAKQIVQHLPNLTILEIGIGNGLSVTAHALQHVMWHCPKILSCILNSSLRLDGLFIAIDHVRNIEGRQAFSSLEFLQAESLTFDSFTLQGVKRLAVLQDIPALMELLLPSLEHIRCQYVLISRPWNMKDLMNLLAVGPRPRAGLLEA